jgi:hypothetical protein
LLLFLVLATLVTSALTLVPLFAAVWTTTGGYSSSYDNENGYNVCTLNSNVVPCTPADIPTGGPFPATGTPPGYIYFDLNGKDVCSIQGADTIDRPVSCSSIPAPAGGWSSVNSDNSYQGCGPPPCRLVPAAIPATPNVAASPNGR